MKCSKKMFLTFLAFTPKRLLRVFPIFETSVEDNRAHRLSQMVFLNKFLILDHRGLNVKNGVFLDFSPKWLKRFFIFHMIVKADEHIICGRLLFLENSLRGIN